jgi:uncharacterized protein
MSNRLIPTEDGWWCTTNGKAAHLPPGAGVNGELTDAAFQALAEAGFFGEEASRYAVTVLTATSCNLGCGYCLQNTGQSSQSPFAPPRIPKHLLDQDAVDEVGRFVQMQMAASGRTELTLLIFGGEPLLNPQGCTRLLSRLAPVGLSHAEMVSNAVLLTPALARSLRGDGLARIQVTFDGHRADHDRIRVDHRGRPTYDRILENIQAAADATDLAWQFRANISHRTIDRLDDLVDDLARLRTPRVSSLHLALIDDIGIGYPNQIRYTPELASRFTHIIDRAISAGLEVHATDPSLADCPFCGAFRGQTGAVINADGNLYSCWETAGRSDWIVGSVRGGYLPEDEIRDRWVACDYSTARHGHPVEARAFHDFVNGFILDRTYRPGR